MRFEIGRLVVQAFWGAQMPMVFVVGGLAGQSLASNIYVGLALLGLGWNFGFIGATTMLAGSHRPEERGRVQGMNDVLVFGGVTMASLASGGLRLLR